MPWPFKLGHLHPMKALLFHKFSKFFTFRLGRQDGCHCCLRLQTLKYSNVKYMTGMERRVYEIVVDAVDGENSSETGIFCLGRRRAARYFVALSHVSYRGKSENEEVSNLFLEVGHILSVQTHGVSGQITQPQNSAMAPPYLLNEIITCTSQVSVTHFSAIHFQG